MLKIIEEYGAATVYMVIGMVLTAALGKLLLLLSAF